MKIFKLLLILSLMSLTTACIKVSKETSNVNCDINRTFSDYQLCQDSKSGCVEKHEGEELTGEYIKVGCAQEGEQFGLDMGSNIQPDTVCAKGLTAVKNATYIGESDLPIGPCSYWACPCYICVKCPNQECGPGENQCNCPEDCQ